MIAWYLDLQLPVQSVPINTRIVSSNPVHGEVYSIQHFVTCNRSVVFFRVNKTDRHITEILLKVALSIINLKQRQ